MWPLFVIVILVLGGFILWKYPFKFSSNDVPDGSGNVATDVETIEPDNVWTTSNSWPFGKWIGGSKDGKPHGTDVTVIYNTEFPYNQQDPLKRKSKQGQKVVGMYEEGNLVIGDIYDDNGNIVEHNFEPKL